MNIIGHDLHRAQLANLVDKQSLNHAYLFWGPAHVGKRALALALANYLENKSWEDISDAEGLPNKVLVDCSVLTPGISQTIGIEAIRQAQEFLRQKPNRSAYRMVIVDNSEALTHEAQDAMLKIAENPPESTLIILMSQSLELLKPTLISRFQALYFGGVPTPLIVDWLIKDRGLSKESATKLAARSFNQPGRALNLDSEKFKKRESDARKFLLGSRINRKTLLKELVREENFNFADFLDSVIEIALVEKKFTGWHELLALREQATFFNLNPRIQLEYLATQL